MVIIFDKQLSVCFAFIIDSISKTGFDTNLSEQGDSRSPYESSKVPISERPQENQRLLREILIDVSVIFFWFKYYKT